MNVDLVSIEKSGDILCYYQQSYVGCIKKAKITIDKTIKLPVLYIRNFVDNTCSQYFISDGIQLINTEGSFKLLNEDIKLCINSALYDGESWAQYTIFLIKKDFSNIICINKTKQRIFPLAKNLIQLISVNTIFNFKEDILDYLSKKEAEKYTIFERIGTVIVGKVDNYIVELTSNYIILFKEELYEGIT